MKKDLLSKLAVIFLGVSILFNFIYVVFYVYDDGFSLYDAGTLAVKIIPFVLSVIFTALLIVGILTEKKILFCVNYGYGILTNLISIVYYIINIINEADFANFTHKSLIWRSVFSGLSSIAFNAFMLVFILIVFSWKEKSPAIEENRYSVVENKTNFSADSLLEYKQLLDDGAITQEEFDEKKKEILNL